MTRRFRSTEPFVLAKEGRSPSNPFAILSAPIKIISLPVFSTLYASCGMNESASWPQVRYQDRNNVMW